MVALQVYVGGTVESWTVAGGFGQRRFVALTAILIVGLAALLDWCPTRTIRRAATVVLVVLAYWNIALTAEFATGLMDRQRLDPRRNAYDAFVTVPARLPVLDVSLRVRPQLLLPEGALVMRRLRLLYLADIRFPLERANGIQTMMTCHALARRGHAVTLLVRDDTHDPRQDPFDFYGVSRIDGLRIEIAPSAGPAAARRAAYLTLRDRPCRRTRAPGPDFHARPRRRLAAAAHPGDPARAARLRSARHCRRSGRSAAAAAERRRRSVAVQAAPPAPAGGARLARRRRLRHDHFRPGGGVDPALRRSRRTSQSCRTARHLAATSLEEPDQAGPSTTRRRQAATRHQSR